MLACYYLIVVHADLVLKDIIYVKVSIASLTIPCIIPRVQSTDCECSLSVIQFNLSLQPLNQILTICFDKWKIERGGGGGTE